MATAEAKPAAAAAAGGIYWYFTHPQVVTIPDSLSSIKTVISPSSKSFVQFEAVVTAVSCFPDHIELLRHKLKEHKPAFNFLSFDLNGEASGV